MPSALHHPPAFAARQALLLHGTERASLTRTAPPAAAARTTATGWRSTARGTTRRGGAPEAASGRWRGFTATRATTNAKGYSRRPSLAPPAGPGGTPGRAGPAWTGRRGASVRRGCGGTRRRRERCRRGKGRRRRPGACPPPVVPLLILPEPPTLRAESPREWVGRMSAVPCCHDAGRWGSCGSTGGGAAGGFLCTALNVYLYRAYSTGRVPISAELSQLHHIHVSGLSDREGRVHDRRAATSPRAWPHRRHPPDRWHPAAPGWAVRPPSPCPSGGWSRRASPLRYPLWIPT